MLGAGLLLAASIFAAVLVGALALAWLFVRRRGRIEVDDDTDE